MTSIITIDVGTNAAVISNQRSVLYPEKQYFSPVKPSHCEEWAPELIRNNSGPKKRVRFQAKDDHRIILIPRRHDLPPKQFAQIWWTHDELGELKRNWKGVVYYLDQGETHKEARGLEQHTEEGAWEYYSAQRAGWNAVLEEQDHNSCPETISEAYADENAKYVQIALERAKEDAKKAKKIRLRKEEAMLLVKEAQKRKTHHEKRAKTKNKKEQRAADERPSKWHSPPRTSRTNNTANKPGRSSKTNKKPTTKSSTKAVPNLSRRTVGPAIETSKSTEKNRSKLRR